MNDELFADLVESVREGGEILRDRVRPSRCSELPTPDVKKIRALYGLSQAELAMLLGISVRTLQNWEQHRRAPRGPARILLRVFAEHPEAVWDVVGPRHADSSER